MVTREFLNLKWLVADKLVRLLLTTVVGLFVVRHLGPERFGMLAYALAVVAFFQTIAELGLDPIIRRDFVRHPNETAVLASSARALRVLAALATIGLLLGWAFLVESGTPERSLLLILALSITAPSLLIGDSWLRAKLEARRAVVPTWLVLAAGAAARLLAILYDAELPVFAWVATGETLALASTSTLIARRAGLALHRASFGKMRDLLCDCWPLCLSAVAVTTYMRTDVLMLRHLLGPDVTGIYSAATRISEAVYFLPMMIASTLLPTLTVSHQRGSADFSDRMCRYINLSALLAYALTVCLTMLAPVVIDVIFGKGFEAATSVLSIHAWGLLFVFLGVARSQLLVIRGLTRISLYATLLGAITNVALNYILIPIAGANGAAIATVLSFGISAWLSSYFWSATRAAGNWQTAALLLPFTGWRYLRR